MRYEPNSLHFWATTVNSVAEHTAYTFPSSPKYKVISIHIAGLASLFVHCVAPVSPYDIMVNSHSYSNLAQARMWMPHSWETASRHFVLGDQSLKTHACHQASVVVHLFLESYLADLFSSYSPHILISSLPLGCRTHHELLFGQITPSFTISCSCSRTWSL